MKKDNKVTKLIGDIVEACDRKSPAILTGLAVAGLAASLISMYKATPKIKSSIQKFKMVQGTMDDFKEEVTPEDKRNATVKMVKEVAVEALPTVAIAGATAACIIGANHISSTRIAVLSAAYNLAEGSLKEYKGKVEELLGEKKADQIKSALVKDKVDKHPLPKDSQVIMTGSGDVLCLDTYTGRYFMSNAQRINDVLTEYAANCMVENNVSLNEIWDSLGLDHLPMGNDMGFTVDDLDHGKLPIYMSSQLTKDNTPCLCLDYDARPISYHYRR